MFRLVNLLRVANPESRGIQNATHRAATASGALRSAGARSMSSGNDEPARGLQKKAPESGEALKQWESLENMRVRENRSPRRHRKAQENRSRRSDQKAEETQDAQLSRKIVGAPENQEGKHMTTSQGDVVCVEHLAISPPSCAFRFT